jgi:hypothetical protein
MDNFLNSKSTLAKLLATENITVEYRKTQTAAFNVATRTLTLPIWNDMTPEMTDLLIGHEVGHALDTPVEYGDKELQGYGKGFRTFLNVVEDARIERRIKDRYPGLKRSFSKGYQEFISRDFFEVNNKDVSKMLLIDRINLHFKIGPFFPVNFNEPETALVKKVAACDSFDDVISVCKELYDYCKAELDEKRQEAMQEFQAKVEAGEFDDEYSDDFDDMFDESNDDFDYTNPKDVDDADSDDGDDYSDDDNDGYSHGKQEPEYRDPEELKPYDEVKAATDETLQKALKSLTEQKELMVGNVPSATQFNYSNLIVPYKKIIGKIFHTNTYVDGEHKAGLISEFEAKNKNAIAYLVKEFEMKKKAAELRRVTISDTGVLDTNKLHTYKFNDDIFRKVGSISAGKNHGVVMFLDWSGSMCDNMKGTIEQLITMTTFCRKVNIPFEVYAFSTQYTKHNEYATPEERAKTITVTNQSGVLELDGHWNLLNLFSSRMKTSEYRRMANDLLNYGVMMANYYKRGYIEENFGLGGTPLNQCIMSAVGIVNNFRKSYKAEIVDVMFLTDGEDSETIWTSGERYGTVRIGPANYRSVSYLEDKETCKKYRVADAGITPTLLQILKDKTGCNLIGFYILPIRRRHFDNAMARFKMITTNDSFAKFKIEKFFSISNYGYDQYFLIPGGDDLLVDDEDLDDLLGENNTNVSARKLKGAFLKMNKNRLTNRILLSKVIEEIA